MFEQQFIQELLTAVRPQIVALIKETIRTMVVNR